MPIHPNLTDHWFEWEKSDSPKLVAVLKTNAIIIPQTDGFDSGALDDMIDAVRAEYPRVTINTFRIIPDR